MHTEGNDPGRPEGTSPQPSHVRDAEHPGYEIQDVNASGVATFLAGLFGFVLVFFVFCFFMGKVINYTLLKQDGPMNKWQANLSQPGMTPRGDKLEKLASNAAVEQKQLAAMTQAFPTPRLETDDGNQDTADLHAREDLLLDHYSSSGDLQGGAVRIPIDRAMQLIVQRGLGSAPAAAATKPLMAGENAPELQAPLTDGFARTGYELDVMEARNERNNYNRAKTEK